MRFSIPVIPIMLILTAACATTSPIDTPEGIAVLEKVEIGGVNQWLLIRSVNTNLPVLLYLHGGPGKSELPQFRTALSGLESNFITVVWEQRGAGKSFASARFGDDLNFAQYVQDGAEVAAYLKERFGKDKIYLMGHSWGTMLGILMIQDNPQSYYAYIGGGQVVDIDRSEEISYAFITNRATEESNTTALDEMIAIGAPPYESDDQYSMNDKFIIARRWLGRYGGSVQPYPTEKEVSTAWKHIDEYHCLDRFYYNRTLPTVMKHMFGEYRRNILTETATDLEVPVYFTVGRHDYLTPFVLVEEYFRLLNAPHKELIWFDKSSHAPMYEESERFMEIIRSRFTNHLAGDR